PIKTIRSANAASSTTTAAARCRLVMKRPVARGDAWAARSKSGQPGSLPNGGAVFLPRSRGERIQPADDLAAMLGELARQVVVGALDHDEFVLRMRRGGEEGVGDAVDQQAALRSLVAALESENRHLDVRGPSGDVVVGAAVGPEPRFGAEDRLRRR